MQDTNVDYTVDMDSGESKNPLAAVECVENIYSHYKKSEVTIFARLLIFGIFFENFNLVRTQLLYIYFVIIVEVTHICNSGITQIE